MFQFVCMYLFIFIHFYYFIHLFIYLSITTVAFLFLFLFFNHIFCLLYPFRTRLFFIIISLIQLILLIRIILSLITNYPVFHLFIVYHRLHSWKYLIIDSVSLLLHLFIYFFHSLASLLLSFLCTSAISSLIFVLQLSVLSSCGLLAIRELLPYSSASLSAVSPSSNLFTNNFILIQKLAIHSCFFFLSFLIKHSSPIFLPVVETYS